MSFYDKMTALADKFTKGEFFTDATISRKKGSGFNPNTGKVNEVTSSHTPCRAVVSELTTKGANGALMSNTMIVMDTEPKSDDVITIGINKYRIGDVTTVAPTGKAIIYKAMVVK